MNTNMFNVITVIINPHSHRFGRLVRILGVAPKGEPPFLYDDYDLRRAGGLTESAVVEIQELDSRGLPLGRWVSRMDPAELLFFAQMAASRDAQLAGGQRTAWPGRAPEARMLGAGSTAKPTRVSKKRATRAKPAAG